MTRRLQVAADARSMGRDAADAVAAVAREAVASRGVFTVAFSGGSLPAAVCPFLLELDRQDPLQFRRWRFFLADERLVPDDHPDSNLRSLREQLLDRLDEPVPENQVHAVAVFEGDAQRTAREYERQIRMAVEGRDGVPELDLVLLGMGPDGHTASLFPGREQALRSKDIVLAVEDSPKPPKQRITLSLECLKKARNVFFVAAGKGKQEALRRVFEQEPSVETPSSMVIPESGKLIWFVDREAAEKIDLQAKF